MLEFSLDEQILNDRKSTFLIKVSGKRRRHNLIPGDILVIDKGLPLTKDKLAVVVVKGKFTIDLVTEEIIKQHDPEKGDFVWGMVRAIVRELK